MKIGNKNFLAVNRWLGWGDPKDGLWFIGMEERATFNEEAVAQYHNKRYDEVPQSADLNWPVATTTAKVTASLLGISDYPTYRDTILWRKGSRVFNGNILPLGKRNRTDWPKHYQTLFELSLPEYQQYFSTAKTERFEMFRSFRLEMNPQAIICFGKKFWDHFSDLFLMSSMEEPTRDGGCLVFNEGRVILTGHFSRGSAFPNRDVAIVGEHLKRWRIEIRGLPSTT